MNTIQMISIFVSGFAFGLILFIVLEKIFETEIDYDDDDFYKVQDGKLKPSVAKTSNLKISHKQKFIGEKIGVTFSDRFNNEGSSLNNLKSKIIELKNRNKVVL